MLLNKKKNKTKRRMSNG